ncbi:LPS-assembly protein LptD [Marinicellulosiphila megalodicopiae]|uniref:LPS-assembly protein LptD n=1 Tax=Marinicellulosiphila megalodicopiae TaxID=2724896 RepID=UPI003BB03085
MLRFLLLQSLLFLAASAWAQEMNLDFVPYDELSTSQQKTISQSCSGQFVDRFNEYSENAEEGVRKAQSQSQSLMDQTWILEGNAIIIEKSIVLLSQSIEMHESTGQTLLNGQTQMRFDGLMLQGDSVEMDIKKHTGTIKNAQFVIHGSNVNGSANEIRRDENGVFYLKDFTISRCNPDQKSWWLKGSKLKIDPNTGMITSVNNWLWVGGVPVFFTPYIHMPFDDHATSGLLVPTFALTDGKLSEFNQPIYFRFKPNIDMTTTVSYLTQTINDKEKSGVLLNNELRFLGNRQQGQLLGAYSVMPSRTQGNSLKNIDRYYLTFEQQWNLGWFTSDIELNALSDQFFFQDFYRGIETNSAMQSMNNRYQLDDTLIYQTLDASWALEMGADKFHRLKHVLNTKELGWDLYFKQQWQQADDRKDIISIADWSALSASEKALKTPVFASEYAFQVAPSFEAKYKTPSVKDFKINQSVSLQVANFDRQLPTELSNDVAITEQLRLSVKSNYAFPMSVNIANTDATYKVKPNLLVQGAIYPDAEVLDEQKIGYLSAMSTFTQQLNVPVKITDQQQLLVQPELIWQYAPFVDTSYLPVLDSANQSSSYGNSIRFTGTDRLGDTSELHYGVGFSLQKNKRTHTKFSIKQSKLIKQELLNLQSVAVENPEFERFSNYNVQASFTPNSATSLSGIWGYSPEWLIETRQVEFKYKLPNNHYIRLTSYSDYSITDDDVNKTELSTHLLSLSGQWALNHQIGLIGYGKWQYNLANEEAENYQLEEMAIGVEYDDCCWAFRMLSYNNFLDEEHEDNKLHFQVIFKGMGRLDQGFDTTIDKYLPAYPGSLFEQD